MPKLEKVGRVGQLKFVGIAVVAVFGLWMYYPALSLPLSLIDDYAMLHHMEQWISNWREGGITQALEKDISITQRIYNTGFWLLTAAELRLSGGQPFHWLKLAGLVFVCSIIFLLIRQTTIKNRTSLFMGLAAVVLFLIGEVPGATDLQSLRANWYRLFTSDSDGLVFLAAHIYCILAVYKSGPGARSWAGWAVAALVAGVLAFSIKLPFIALVCGPLVCLIVGTWLLRKRRTSLIYLCIIAVLVMIFGIYNVVLRSFSDPENTVVYSANFSFSPENLTAGVKYFALNYWNILGPLLPAAIAGIIMMISHAWRQRDDSGKQTFVIALYVAAFAVCATAMYVPWNFRLPRYMLTGYFGVVILVGLAGCFIGSSIVQQRRLYLLLIPVGAMATLSPPLVLLLLLLILCVVFLVWKKQFAVPVVAGVGLAGFAYMLAIAPITRAATNHDYVGREFANWQATLNVLKYSAEKQQVCFAGDAGDEQIGSMYGHINRLGIEPLISGVDDSRCTTDSVLLVNYWLTPATLQQKVAGLPVLYEIEMPQAEFQVPTEFWDFRNRLLSGEAESLLTYVRNIDFAWKFYAHTPQAAALLDSAE